MLRGSLLMLACLGAMPSLLGLSQASAQDTERAALLAERQLVQARFDAQEQACLARFVVTPCLDEVMRQRRVALQPLVAKERALDASHRAQKALERISARSVRSTSNQRSEVPQGDEPKVPPAQPLGPVPGLVLLPQPQPQPLAAVDPASWSQRQADEAAARAQQAAERAATTARRLQTQEALRAKVAQRVVEHAASLKKSAPLEAAASSPQRR